MKAALLDNGQVRIDEVAKPEPRHEEALVRLTAAGVCHSDLHLVRGDWPGFNAPRPMKLGHEGIGVVEALGPGAEPFVQPGDRVILGLGGAGGGYWCGACEYCLGGRPRLCSEAKGIMGAYAEYIRVWAKSLVKLPETVGDEQVPLACGGLTAYSAVKKLLKFGVLPGKPVAIVGAAGGLGHYAVQVAHAFGYRVIGIDVGQDKIDFVRSLGVTEAVDAEDALEVVKRGYGGSYASLVFASRLAGFELGLKLLRRGGVFVSVGMPAASEGHLALNPLELLSKDLLITSSAVGTVEEMRELVRLAADGDVKTHVSRTGRLSDVTRIMDELEAGQYAGRAILNDLGG